MWSMRPKMSRKFNAFWIESIDVYGKVALRFKIGYNGTRLISHPD
jgi:hypothetical protein